MTTADKKPRRNDANPFNGPNEVLVGTQTDEASITRSRRLASMYITEPPEALLEGKEWRNAPGVTARTEFAAYPPRFVLFFGRSGLGKSMLCAFNAEAAIAADVNVLVADFDRDNASLTARFGAENVARPDSPTEPRYEAALKKLHETQVRARCDVLLDAGFGSLRSICGIFGKLQLQSIQEAHGIRPVLVILLGLNRDDLMVLDKLDGAYLPYDIILVLNEGKVPPEEDIALAFEPVLSDARIVGLLKRGLKAGCEVRIVRMPVLPSGEKFFNTREPFERAARADWKTPLDEFERAEAEVFLDRMRTLCQENSDLLPFPPAPLTRAGL